MLWHRRALDHAIRGVFGKVTKPCLPCILPDTHLPPISALLQKSNKNIGL
jgi:hypothetical protein